MNPITLFILIVVLLILIYILYYYFFSTTTYINSSVLNLNTVVVPYTKLASPANVRYAFGVWVYVNNLGPNNTILSRPSSSTYATAANNFKLYLDATTPTLYCYIQNSDATKTQPTAITNNFPIQRWCFIVVSVDGQFIDYYLNGKLIKSEKKSTILATPPDGNTPLYLGNTPFLPFDAYLGRVIRWSSPVDPQTAWDTYLSGNGVSSSVTPYHANLSIMKDHVTTSTYKLW